MDIDNLAESQFLKGLDALYERGGDDQYAGLKFDPRGCQEYQAVLDLVRTALKPPEGYVLVPSDSVKQCACGCGRYCCTHCGTELGGFAARPEVP